MTSSAMPRLRRVSMRQIELLWGYLNCNRDIANAHNRSLHEKEYSQKKWKEIAEILNAEPIGTQKNWKGWSKYWVDYKAKLKMKLAAKRSSQEKSDGETPFDKSLTDIDQKFLEILGEPELSASGMLSWKVTSVELQRSERSPSTDIEPQDTEVLETTPNTLLHTEPISQDPPSNPSCIPSPFPQLVLTPLRTSTVHSKSPTPPSPRNQPRVMSRKATRRALIRSSKIRAEAAVRTSVAIEKMVQHMAELQNTALRIERILKVAFPRAAAQENGI